MKLTYASRAALFTMLVLPFGVFAQATVTTATDIPSLFLVVIGWINGIVVPLVFAIAFVAFLVGIYYYFIQNAASAEKRKEGNQFLLWSLIGFFIMFSVWGLVNLFLGTLGFNNSAQPSIPIFTNTSSTGVQSGTSGSIFGGTGTTGTPGSLPGGSLVPATASGCPAGTTPVTGTSNCMVPSNSTLGQGADCGANQNACQAGYACNDLGLCEPAAQSNTLGPGGDCSGNDNACQAGLTCNNEGLCEAPTQNGSQPVGGDCSGNEDACQNGSICSEQGVCVAIPQDGAVGTGGSCEGNENACVDGDTCDNDTDTCQVDASVDNGNTTVDCGNGITADSVEDCPDGGSN